MYKSKSIMFRDLDDNEEKEFRQWVRDNYKKNDPIPEIWHPVCVDECQIINS